MFLSNRYLPHITKATGVTHNTATLIGNIYTSCKNTPTYFSGILVTDLSDHFQVLTFAEKTKGQRQKSETITFRDTGNKLGSFGTKIS